MKVGVYSARLDPITQAMIDGLGVMGFRVDHRAQEFFSGEVEPFDLVVVRGMRGRSTAVVDAYKDIPVLVLDAGYLKRDDGYCQIGLRALNQLPGFECPADRFEALGLNIAKTGGNPDGYTLVCGQIANDAAHGMDAHTHRTWLREQMAAYENAVYRPHPRGGIAIPGFVGDSRVIDDALAGARLVVTYNSGTGHEALLAGVPVIAHGPAAYDSLVGERLPSTEERLAYFNRLAYAQWTMDEIRTARCFDFVLNHLIPDVPIEAVEESAPAAKKKRGSRKKPSSG